MTSTEFNMKMLAIAKKKRDNKLSNFEIVENTLEVLRDFSNELVNDLTAVLNFKVSSETVSVVIEILEMLAKDYKDMETIQSKNLLGAYKLGLSVDTEQITVTTPIFGKEDNNGFMF